MELKTYNVIEINFYSVVKEKILKPFFPAFLKKIFGNKMFVVVF
jgi:hypothetical protein